jgi:hypothetical protein
MKAASIVDKLVMRRARRMTTLVVMVYLDVEI